MIFSLLVPVTAGIVAISTWLCIASISTPEKIKKIGATQWVVLQRSGGWIAFIAVYLHLVIMKHDGWIKWWNGHVKASSELANPSYPPASIFVFIILTLVFIFRGIIFLKKSLLNLS